jgi:hypothetical protein
MQKSRQKEKMMIMLMDKKYSNFDLTKYMFCIVIAVMSNVCWSHVQELS